MKNVLALFAIAFTFFATPASTQAQGNPFTLEIVPDQDTLFVCAGESVQLEARGANTFRWVPSDIFDDPTIANPTVENLNTDTWVVVESVVNGTIEFDSIFLDVVTPSLQLSSNAIQPICRGETVTLSAINNVNGQGLNWSSTEGILTPDLSATSIVVQPQANTTYTATLSVQNCVEQSSISVDVRPDRVDINNPDTVYLCKGEEVTISATTTSSGNEDFRWFSSFGVLGITEKSFTVTPERNVTIYAEVITDNCTVLDSTFIQIDSLPPDLTLTPDPEKNAYCEGDIVTLTSPTYEPSDFPDITHLWVSAPSGAGFETPDTLYNMVFTAQDTAIFQRTTINNGCRDSVQIFIPVIKPPMITIEPDNPVLCPGESVQLEATFDGNGEIEWMPVEGLSCVDCPDPVVTPTTLTATYTITVTEEDCPASQSITIQVLPPPVTLNSNLTICAGESIQLLATANTNANATFEWREAGSNNIISTDPFFEPAPATNTTFELTAQYPNCDPLTFSIPVRVIQEPNLTVSAGASVCPGESVTLSAASDAPDDVNSFFQWTINGQNIQGEDVSFSPNASTVAELTYTYGNNCGVLTETVPIAVFEVPVIEELIVNPEDAATNGVPLGESIGIRAVTVPETPEDATFSWTKNGVDFAGNVSEIEDMPSESPTVYELTITTAEGCTVTADVSINVVAPKYEVPNAFSPNGDNVNDFFNIVFVGAISVTEFRIYNRWGEQVYNNETPETGWDGNVSGTPAPSDVYIFQIGILFPDGQLFTEQGEVTLIR